MINRTGERMINPKVDMIKSKPLFLRGTFSGSKGIQVRYFE